MILPCFIRRLIETVLVPILLSVVFGLIVTIKPDIGNSPVLLGIIMSVCLFLVIIIYAYMLRSYFFFVKNTFDYFTVNLSAYLVSFIINIITYSLYAYDIISKPFYVVPYFVYDFFCQFGVSMLASTLFVHGIMVIMIFLAPFELYSVIGRMNRSARR